MAKSKENDKKSAEAEVAHSVDKGLSFEEAMIALQQIVNDLEDNSLGLEASLAQFERGIGLLRQCNQYLEQAEQKIELLINLKPDGEATTAPFDATPTAGSSEPKTLF